MKNHFIWSLKYNVYMYKISLTQTTGTLKMTDQSLDQIILQKRRAVEEESGEMAIAFCTTFVRIYLYFLYISLDFVIVWKLHRVSSNSYIIHCRCLNRFCCCATLKIPECESRLAVIRCVNKRFLRNLWVCYNCSSDEFIAAPLKV